jgi:hypothetical protein
MIPRFLFVDLPLHRSIDREDAGLIQIPENS